MLAFLFTTLMRAFIFLSFFLLAAVVRSIPVPFGVDILADTSSQENRESKASNANRIKKAAKKADELLHGMTYNIEVAASGNDGDHPEEEARMRAAFGPKWRNNIDEIRQTAQAMRDQRLNINDANPETYDRELQKGSGDPSQRGMAVYSHTTDSARLGSLWHHEATNLHRVGTLIHELSHKTSRTGDHIDVKHHRVVTSTEANQLETEHVENATGLKGDAAWNKYYVDKAARIEKEAADRERAASSQKRLGKKNRAGQCKRAEDAGQGQENSGKGKEGSRKGGKAAKETWSSEGWKGKERSTT